MIIKLDDRGIYISKDTVVAYAKEENATCKYLEINQVIESTEFHNWTPRPRPNVDSDLVLSPAQVTENHHVELMDQHISQDTKDRFKELKKKCPEVFSLNNQDIGHTNLVTIHVDTGDSPPICQKPYTLPL